jgi:phosphotriesterase-related protein
VLKNTAQGKANPMPGILYTTQGAKRADELGMILPHEHLFVDLGPIEATSYINANVAEAVEVMAPEVEKIKAQGITALVECTPVGVGRRADIDLAISKATDFPVVLPTGIYREPWVPQWAREAHEDAICEWMVQELTEGIEQTGIQAAWIKVSAGDDGLTDIERKILRAAARAGAQTGAIIGSHTIRGWVAREQLQIIEQAGYRPDRFIWIHTQAEPDVSIHLEIGGRGAWLEYDSIGSKDDEWFVEAVKRVLDAGLGKQLLLSQDRGWYDPSMPRGGKVMPFTHLVDSFLPKLRAAGVDEATVTQLMRHNPFAAYAR